MGLEEAWLSVPCPACGFSLDVQFVDVATRSMTRCRCCRRLVQLEEVRGSMTLAIKQYREEVEGLAQAIENANRRHR